MDVFSWDAPAGFDLFLDRDVQAVNWPSAGTKYKWDYISCLHWVVRGG